MEEILASIRRIIADDQSLPSHVFAREPEPAARTEPAADAAMPSRLDEARHAPPHVAPLAAPEREAPMFQPTDAHRETPAEAAFHAAPVRSEPPAAPEPAAAHAAEGPAPGIATLSGDMAYGSVDAPQFAMPDAVPAGLSEASQAVSADAHAAEMPNASGDRAEEGADVGGHAPVAQPASSGQSPGDVARSSDLLFSAATDSSVAAAFKTLAAARLADNADDLLDIARDMIRPLLKTWIDDNLPSMVERLVRAEIERVSRGGR